MAGVTSRQPPGNSTAFPLAATMLIFAAACTVLAWPWLSGAVTIPWDAKSQFLPQVRFLARALADGESPFWTPNVFAGWPQIADPQSLIFSPLHVLLAWLDPAPGFRAIDGVTFALLFLGGVGIILFFRDRGWHAAGALVAAIAFAFGGSANARLQHTGQIISLVYFPLTLWLLARALDRSSLRAALRGRRARRAHRRSDAIRWRSLRSICWPASSWRIGSMAAIARARARRASSR